MTALSRVTILYCYFVGGADYCRESANTFALRGKLPEIEVIEDGSRGPFLRGLWIKDWRFPFGKAAH